MRIELQREKVMMEAIMSATFETDPRFGQGDGCFMYIVLGAVSFTLLELS